MTIVLATASCFLCVCTVIAIRNLLSTKEQLDERKKGIQKKEKALEEKEQKLDLRELDLITDEVSQKRSRVYRVPTTPIRIVKFDGALFMIRDDEDEVITLTEEPMAEMNVHGIMNEKMRKLYNKSIVR